jgi:hypothetical protein
LGAANATQTSTNTAAVVHLAARQYQLSTPISLPNRTALAGAGRSSTTLLFQLVAPRKQDFSHIYNQSAAVEVRLLFCFLFTSSSFSDEDDDEDAA